MYYIKQIDISNLEKTIKITNGVKTYLINNKYMAVDDFWGQTDIMVGEFADKKLFKEEDKTIFISYVNECIPKDMGDGFKRLELNISTPNEVEGYIVIIKYAPNIKTDGEVLFRRYSSEIVAKLKEGQYLNLYDKQLKVIDNKLCLIL